MALSKLSLNQNKESKKLSVSKNVVATHLIPVGNSTNGPILWLTDDITEIYLSILYNKYVLAAVRDLKTGKKITAQSSECLSELLSGFDVPQQSMLNRDLIIYSCICEACSKVEIPPEVLENNMDFLVDFIEKSLYNFGYDTWNIRFDYLALKNFLVLERAKPTELEVGLSIMESPPSSKGVMFAVRPQHIYVQKDANNLYRMQIPTTFHSIRDSKQLSNCITSLFWILVFTLGLYDKEDFKYAFFNIRCSLSLDESSLNKLPFFNN